MPSARTSSISEISPEILVIERVWPAGEVTGIEGTVMAVFCQPNAKSRETLAAEVTVAAVITMDATSPTRSRNFRCRLATDLKERATRRKMSWKQDGDRPGAIRADFG